jgi:signal transduction histidine kinase/DNA-binding response OmpR family regulator/HAMP domain-containing protein
MTLSPFRAQQPFWLGTFISGGSCLSTLTVLLVAYARTAQWQYLALSVIVGMIVLAHGIAWRLALKQERYDWGIRIIAAAHILSGILAPLFMADYLTIGLFLLAIVPFEVGLADRLQRIPLFAVLALLGAAGMVAVDLLNRPERLSILSDLPGAATLAIALLILQIVGLLLLLWRFRLRPRASHRSRMDLVTQQVLVFTVISASSIVVVTGVLIAQIQASQIEKAGQNFQTLAQINGERVGNGLEQQIVALVSLGRREQTLQDFLAESNASYPESSAAIQERLRLREEEWQNSPDNSPFVLTYRNNPVTVELSAFRGADLLHNNVFLTDRYGALVAAQGERPSHFYFGDADWWQAAWNNGQGDTYLNRLQIDPDTAESSIFIAVGVLNPLTNQIIGVLASTYDLRAIQRDINAPNAQAAGEVILIASDGRVIASPYQEDVGWQAWKSLLESGIVPASGQLAAPADWRLGTDRAENQAVLAHSPLSTTSGVRMTPLRGLNWQIIVSDTQQNALAEVTQSTKVAALVGLVVIALVVLAVSAMAQVITRPIEALTRVAAAVSSGDLEKRADPVGPTEMVTLAESFNMLTSQLRSLINNLQDQVAQRTAQLESRVEQLATLNRITQTVASVRDLDSALETVAREMGQLFNVRNCDIALLNDDETLLKVVAGYSQKPEDSSRIGIVIPLRNNPSSIQVIKTASPVVVAQAQTSPMTAPIHDVLRSRQTQSLLIVPLLARGQVIGTIGIATGDPDREFTPAEVTLAETVAGQIAGTIDNARLFSEMQQAKEEAEAANEAKSTFLASVSHELRTPLTSVLGFAKIIQKRLEERIFPALQSDDPKIERAITQVSDNINIIVSEGERLTTLINNVLDLAKIEAGKVEWNMEPLTASDVIERATAATLSLFEQSKLNLIKDVPLDLPEFIGDRDRLIQVMINLISNAVKFTPEGAVTCRARFINGQIMFSVIDTGVGIADVDHPRVFEKFVQAGDTLTGKPQGTGLGLPICKEIVEHHGGRIWLESELGRGSNFSFMLPVSDVSAAVQETAPLDLKLLVEQMRQDGMHAAPIANTTRKTILVVDDEAPIRKLIRQQFEMKGYVVREAENGWNALDEVKRTRVDLIILDVRMPEMNGFEVAAIFKNNPPTNNIPIVMLSAYPDKNPSQHVPVERFLNKPFDPATLLAEVEELLSTKPKALVVDEDAAIVEVLSGVFQAQGYSVTAAYSGDELRHKALSIKPDMIIINSAFSDIAESLNREKGLENVFILFYQ